MYYFLSSVPATGMHGIVIPTPHTEPLQMSTKGRNTLGNGAWDHTFNSEAIYKH